MDNLICPFQKVSNHPEISRTSSIQNDALKCSIHVIDL